MGQATFDVASNELSVEEVKANEPILCNASVSLFQKRLKFLLEKLTDSAGPQLQYVEKSVKETYSSASHLLVELSVVCLHVRDHEEERENNFDHRGTLQIL